MLTDAAKEHISVDQLQEFFSPGAEAAYEINRGKKLQDGRYVFPVALFEIADGQRVRPRFSRMVVVRTGKDDWAVDRLP